MNDLIAAPSTTAFEAAASVTSALVYLIVGVAAVAKNRREARAILFLVIAAANVPAYVSAFSFWQAGPGAAWSRPLVLSLWMSTAVASVALFHFAQVFPWRRPWICTRAVWLWVAYAVAPIPIAVLIAIAPASLDQVGLMFVAAAVLIGLPGIAIVGIALPLAGLTSLYKSYVTAKRDGVEAARVTLLWMLISQLAGGVLAIVIIPLLHTVAPRGPYASIASGALLLTGLVMPLSFAVGVWKFRILSIDPERPPQHLDRPFA